MDPPTIDCRNIVKTFLQRKVPMRLLQDRILRWRIHSDRIRIEALRGVSLAARKGEWVGLFGANGSGKTTLMKIIAGIMRQDAGEVSTDGRLSCFFELGVGFHLERCADENIRLHGLLQGMHRTDIRRLTDVIISVAGVRSHANLPLKCYSTGMRMRLAFAAASQVDADIFLFDEILAVGDTDFQKKCWWYLHALKRAGKTGVIASHNMDNLERICDRIEIMDRGILTGSHPIRQQRNTGGTP